MKKIIIFLVLVIVSSLFATEYIKFKDETFLYCNIQGKQDSTLYFSFLSGFYKTPMNTIDCIKHEWNVITEEIFTKKDFIKEGYKYSDALDWSLKSNKLKKKKSFLMIYL